MIYYGENTNIFAHPTSPGPCFIISFSKNPYFLLKMIGKIVKISSFASGQNWQQNVGQLTSADDSYQMVGLCDYKNALLSHLQYI